MASLRSMSIKAVTSRIRALEETFKGQNKVNPFENSTNISNESSSKVKNFFRRYSQKFKNYLQFSRYSGLPFAALYGSFLFLYLNYLIVPQKNLGDIGRIKKPNISTSCSRPAKHEDINILNNTTNNGTTSALMISKRREWITTNSRTISSTPASNNVASNASRNIRAEANKSYWNSGSAISLYAALGLTLTTGVSSIFSKHTRCMMILVLPGLITGRGRAILMTLVIGMLVDGPVNSINYNINEVVESNACMYESMKGMACSYATQMEQIIEQAARTINKQGQRMYEELQSVTENIRNLTDNAKKEFEKREQQLKARMVELQKKVAHLKHMSQDLARPCKWSNSVLSGARDFFKGFGEAVTVSWSGSSRRHVDWQWYGQVSPVRKRRDIVKCKSIIPFPSLSKLKDGLNLESIKKLNAWAKDLVPEFDLGLFDKPNLESLLKAPSIAGIREKIIKTVSQIFDLLKTRLQVVKKVFMILSMLILVYISYRYLQNYYSDDSFDNQFIDDNIRDLWRKGGYPKLTPLRNWELKAHYKVSASAKLSKKEIKNTILKMLPTFVVCLVVTMTIFGDYALAALLSGLATHGKFAISFEGMEQGYTVKESILNNRNLSDNQEFWLKLEKVDLSTEPCLPRPLYTDQKETISIIVLLVVMAFSCLFDAYFSRVRAQICNLFYEERARERGEYLYERLKSGRNIRRLRFRMIILKELKRRKKLEEFSWFLHMFPKLWGKIWQKKHILCPGCMKDTKLGDTKSLRIDENEPNALVCTNCTVDI